MRLISPDKVRTHTQRSVLNRAIGIGLFVRPDYTTIKLREDDRLVLCSDGLWAAMEDEDLAAIAWAAKDVDEACAALIRAALERGSDDNVSAIVVRFGQPRAGHRFREAGGRGGINGGLMGTLRSLTRSANPNH
jgi:protein phosphatase